MRCVADCVEPIADTSIFPNFGKTARSEDKKHEEKDFGRIVQAHHSATDQLIVDNSKAGDTRFKGNSKCAFANISTTNKKLEVRRFKLSAA